MGAADVFHNGTQGLLYSGTFFWSEGWRSHFLVCGALFLWVVD
ncbi:MAG: hypothetical protein ACRC8Y_22010 [Chroococcales cyanobacterium]